MEARRPRSGATIVALDRATADRLETDGFAVVPVATGAVIARLAAAASPVSPADGRMVFSDHALAPSARRAFQAELRTMIEPAVLASIPDHRVVAATVVAKGPGPDSALGWHVDPSITDERRWRSLSLWIPLTETGPADGALEVLRGGHRGAPVDRGGRGRLVDTHPSHDTVLAACRAAGGTPTGPLRVPLGSGVLYDHRAPHRSGPNRGTRVRLALNIGLLPVDAPLSVFVWDERGVATAHLVRDDFFASEDLSADPSTWASPGPAADVAPGLSPDPRPQRGTG